MIRPGGGINKLGPRVWDFQALQQLYHACPSPVALADMRSFSLLPKRDVSFTMDGNKESSTLLFEFLARAPLTSLVLKFLHPLPERFLSHFFRKLRLAFQDHSTLNSLEINIEDSGTMAPKCIGQYPTFSFACSESSKLAGLKYKISRIHRRNSNEDESIHVLDYEGIDDNLWRGPTPFGNA
jgi:hypothetical protein